MEYYTYMEAIGVGFPNVQAHALGRGENYSDLIWDGGAALPSQETLDEWISANPKPAEIVLSRYEFRKLFTFNERVAIDNAYANTNSPTNYRAAIVTMLKDLEVSGAVFLDSNEDVAAGLNLLEQLGLIAPGRAAQILANQPPSV